MLNNWGDFVLESLILESKLEFSDKFKRVLEFIPKDNQIRNTLLSMRGADDINLVQNYIDISGNKEEVTFIQDRRAQQLIRDNPVVWKTNSSLPGSKFLTFNKNDEGEYKNQSLFDKLGFVVQEPVSENHPIPGPGVVGEILAETVSTLSRRTYILFQWKDGEGDTKQVCLNKEAVDQHSETEKMIYSSGRNPIRIGRLVNSIMSAAKQPVTPQEVEQFSNAYKSAWDMMNDAFLKFDIVSGYDISKWYHEYTYESDDSTLGGSCMRYDYCSEFFGIYTENSDVVKLVILYSDRDGGMKDGKFIGRYIKGRALLWKTNQGDMFMDRIYTNNDSDVELFKQFAEKNGWWCKKVQNSNNRFTAQRGSALKDPTYTVDLQWADHEYYPYVDTLSYMKLNQLSLGDNSGVLSNDNDVINANYDLRDTEGDRDPL
jgi:hypothetical protein